jgi:hypothetical protein
VPRLTNALYLKRHHWLHMLWFEYDGRRTSSLLLVRNKCYLWRPFVERRSKTGEWWRLAKLLDHATL